MHGSFNCTVLLNVKAIYSCLTLAVECEGQSIETIEALSKDGKLHPIQQAFIDKDGYQGGFCTPGQILAVKALLDKNSHPSADEVKRAVSGNLCRCGAKGLGEPPIIPLPAAVANAVADALGQRIYGLPLTPDYVLMQLQKNAKDRGRH